MNSDEIEVLGQFYSTLCNSIRKNKKISVKNSLIMIFLKTKPINIRQILREGGISKIKFNDNKLIENLLNCGFIRPAYNPIEYIITPKGIWEYENQRNLSDLNKFLNFIDKEYFDLFQSQENPLDAKDKVVIYSMIAIRTFNKENVINLNIDEMTLKKWVEIFEKSKTKLYDLNIINNKENINFWKKSKENKEKDIDNPCYYLLRHRNKLSGRTNDLYKSPGNKIYYLDLSENLDVIKEQLIFLLHKIFDKKQLEIKEKEDIINFFKEISFNYHLQVFNGINKFVNPVFDNFLKDITLYL